MDISNIKNFITANAGKSLLVGRKYSPEILTAVGVGTFAPSGWDREYCKKCYKRIY